MKKILLPLIAIALFVVQGNAQDIFVKGDKVLNLSVGVGSSIYSGSAYGSVTPALAGSFEVGVVDDLFDESSALGIGGYIGYTGAKWDAIGSDFKTSSFIIGARGAVHYQFIDRLDTYGGLMLGYNIVNSDWDSNTPGFDDDVTSSAFLLDLFIGGRYYFTDNVAGLVEIGSGIAYLNIGVALKL